MNRLEARVARLEEVGPIDDGEGLLGVTRILLDQHGNELRRDFLMAPVAPLRIPVPPPSEPIDPEYPTPEIPVLTSYVDEPRFISRNQWAGFKKVISGKSRSVHQEPLTEEDKAELARIFS